MSNPTSGWDKVPIFGTWLNLDRTPKVGVIRFTLAQRVNRIDGSAVYPRDGTITVPLGLETGSITVLFPASDDPDINPTGWKIRVSELLTDGSGQSYEIQPKLSDLPGGVNLNLILVPSGGA